MRAWCKKDRMAPSKAVVKLAVVQMRCTDDARQNLAAAEQGIREAAGRGAQLVCLPELFRSLYFCQTEDHAQFDLAEPVPGPTTNALGQLAKELGVTIVSSVFERRAAGVYHNTAAILDATGELAGIYRKMHIPDDPLYYEKFYFTPGDLGFRSFDTRAGRIGTLVCWDQWFPEGARLTAMQGPWLLSYPTAIGWHPREKAQYGEAQASAWQTMQRSHAIANGVFVAAINRVGHEGPKDGGIEFWGGSFVCDPFGVVLAEASRERAEVLVVECDLSRQEDVRRNWPFLRDRRIDAYGELTCRLLDKK
jgi:N-carbamoylputrescine amidase